MTESQPAFLDGNPRLTRSGLISWRCSAGAFSRSTVCISEAVTEVYSGCVDAAGSPAGASWQEERGE